jgi:hypothetical protein
MVSSITAIMLVGPRLQNILDKEKFEIITSFFYIHNRPEICYDESDEYRNPH